ncbi:hypothetical protein BH11ARM2_BH11ARM2_01110 [soil metagenome]
MALARNRTTLSPKGESETGEGLIAAYGEVLASHLAGRVSASERGEIRSEAEFHLELGQRRWITEGMDPLEAARKAIRNYGDPCEVVAHHIEGRQDEGIGSRWLRTIGYSRLLAILIYGTGQLGATIYQSELWAASVSGRYGMPMAPAQLRALLPLPLPLPQTLSEVFALYGLPFLWPLLAGLIFGACAPVRPVSATLMILVPLTLQAFVQASLMLPATSGQLNALLLLFVGIPLACVGSLIGTSARRSWEIRREGVRLMQRVDATE